ncbi:MAG: 2'-deoxycytidine 5'-triphosphate deaminase, partial [Pseudomonadota bacterium]
NQLRLRRGTAAFPDTELQRLHLRETLVSSEGDADIQEGIACSVDLGGEPGSLIGYCAKRHAAVVDMDAEAAYDAHEFWDPVTIGASRRLILDPNEFYILVSKEAIHIPPKYAAEMVAIDPTVGEFRVHYAGFFDPGFGNRDAGGDGSRAVLEVRSHDVPFVLEDGQKVARLRYERMEQRPSQLYGEHGRASYQRQGLQLSRHFKPAS